MSNRDLTRRQHFVPRIYQRGWTQARWSADAPADQDALWAYDLQGRRAFKTCPNGVLAANWFYERDADAPDNEIETSFRKDEAEYATTMRFMDFACSNALAIAREGAQESAAYVGRTFASYLQAFPEYLTTLKRFAALCYVRVPAAMNLKRNELVRNLNSAHLAEALTLPHKFLTFARESTLIDRFNGLSVQLWITLDADFVTSDRPCFDVDTSVSGYHPLSGYAIGRRNDVIAMFPLSHRMLLLLIPTDLHVFGQLTSQSPSIRVVGKDAVRRVNSMIVNFAERWIIAREREEAIFDLRVWPVARPTSARTPL